MLAAKAKSVRRAVQPAAAHRPAVAEILPAIDKPIRIGQPLAAETWGRVAPSFPKSSVVIEVADNLTLVERKLFNVLLAHSYPALQKEASQQFEAPAADIRRAIGWDGHDSNGKLIEALQRLQQTLVTIDYSGRTGLRKRSLTLLTMTDVPQREGVVMWRFNSDLTPHLVSPSQYARIHLVTCQRFGSGYALRLYEQLTLRVPMAQPWVIEVEDLRVLLGATSKSLTNWAQFERKVLAVAQREINEHALFEVGYVPIRAAGSKRIAQVEFSLAPKGPKTLPVRRAAKRGRDDRTLDLLAELDAPLAPPEASFTLEVRRELSRLYPGSNLDDVILDWCWSQRVRGEAIADPVRAFTEYLAAGTRQSTRSDDDTRLAVDWMSAQNAQRRAIYLKRARRKQPDLDVASTAKEHFGLWIDLVVPDLRAEGAI